MKKHNLKGAYVQYIAAMDRYEEGITAVKLCEVCERDKAAVSRALGEMEAQGIVCKLEDHGVYRNRFVLTAKGKETASYIKERAISAVTFAGKDLSEENRQIFYEALQVISENLRTLSEDGVPAGSDPDESRKKEA